MTRTIHRARLVLIIAIMLFAGAPATRADEPATRPAPGAGFAMRIEAMKRAVEPLKLTDEQKPRIAAIFDKASADMRDKFEQMQMDNTEPRDRFTQMRTMFDDLIQQIKDVLNDDQKVAFQKQIDDFQKRAAGQGAGVARGGQFGQRLRDAMAKLDLTDGQKEKIKEIIDEDREKFQGLRDSAQGDPQMMQEKGQAVFQDMRQRVAEVLSDEQQQKLMDLMSGPDQPGTGQRQSSRRNPTTRPGKMKTLDDKPANKSSTLPSDSAGGLSIGDTAPNFELKKLDGRPVQLAVFKGRVGVLVFGSYSTPTFRHQAPALEQLRKQYGAWAEFLIIYTKESHPKGSHDVERNKQDDVSVDQPQDNEDRLALAKKAREALKLTIPIALDSMDNATTTAYGTFPNGAAVIGRDGRIFAIQKWCDPYTLGMEIEMASKDRGDSAAQ